MERVVYTIGHSHHTAEQFERLLTRAKIEVLVDVRSNPLSSFAPWANKDDLPRLLKRVHIDHVYLGNLLGGRPDHPDCYDSAGKPLFEKMLNKDFFQRGLDQLVVLLDGPRRVCIMCAEEDPGLCHRNLLVGEGLRQRGIRLLHIRASGQIQTDRDLWKERAGASDDQLPLPM